MAARRDGKAGLPSREQLRAFIAATPGRVGKREIVREFALGPAERGAVREMLAEIAAEGKIAPAGARRFAAVDRPGDTMPGDTMVVEITGTDRDGDAVGRPATWPQGEAPPQILMAAEPRGRPALAPGQKILARIKPIGPGRFEGRTIKRLGGETGRIVGVYRPAQPGARPPALGRPTLGHIVPTDRRSKAEWVVPAGEEGGAEAGEIVRAEPIGERGFGLKPARIVERLGRLGDARSVSLICIAAQDIPVEFSPESLAEAGDARGVTPGRREDLRDIPLVTIDGADARDFDDAVFAEPDGAGWRLIVAIADVSHYVRPGSALDRDARRRGNSVYFPDRVVPMLPEALSNGWCSLRPDEERGCLFADMRIDAAGKKIAHRFGRGIMRSAARLTYEEVQAMQDAGGDAAGRFAPLYRAFDTLLAARRARGTLDLDLPERVVTLTPEGQVRSVAPRPRLDSHRLIEEFMVLANVAAAEELERLHAPCVYRVHAPPSPEKLIALRSFLRTFDISLPAGDAVHPRDLERVLQAVAGTEHAPVVNEVMLRSQSQAEYSPDNIGHFGLALSRYAHFTSPIRRYADLLVHRSLVRALRLGPGGLAEDEAAGLEDTATHITATERRAALAERDAIDRYLAAFMQDKVGAEFAARISGVTRFAAFVTVQENGASGIIPISTLPDDFWMHDAGAQTLTGRRSGVTIRLAQEVSVRLSEASPVTGGLVFQLLAEAAGQTPARGRGKSYDGKPQGQKSQGQKTQGRKTQGRSRRQ